MKKLIELLMVLLLGVSLCACTTMSKEDMISEATTLLRRDVINDMEENFVNAKEKYNGMVAIFNDVTVNDISSKGFSSDYIMTFDYGFTTLGMDIRLSKDDIMKLKEGDEVNVVGIIKVNYDNHITLKDAHLI